MRPAAEDGVRQSGTALGAPHQLQQLFGHFGHDGNWTRSGSLLLGLRSRNIGKGRLEKRAAGRQRSDANGRSRWVRAAHCRHRPPVKPGEAATRSFPCRKRPDFRLPLAPPPRRAGRKKKISSPEAEVERESLNARRLWLFLGAVLFGDSWTIDFCTALPGG